MFGNIQLKYWLSIEIKEHFGNFLSEYDVMITGPFSYEGSKRAEVKLLKKENVMVLHQKD